MSLADDSAAKRDVLQAGIEMELAIRLSRVYCVCASCKLAGMREESVGVLERRKTDERESEEKARALQRKGSDRVKMTNMEARSHNGCERGFNSKSRKLAGGA